MSLRNARCNDEDTDVSLTEKSGRWKRNF